MENISKDLCVICHREKDQPSPMESSRTLGRVRAFARKIQKKEVLTTLPCGHQYHYACIKKWVDINPQCPMDRGIVTKTSLCTEENMRKELKRSIIGGEIDNVRAILSAGFDPNHRSFLHRIKPLYVALVEKQWEITAELIRAGATTRNKIAQYYLGWMHHKGKGVQQNYAEALTWYRKAADQGFVFAQNQLGWMHQKGQGVQQNYAEALTWYRKAADRGHVASQNNLGWMYQNGLGVAKNCAKALSWYRKAADQGDASAQNNLGWMYCHNDLGVQQNYAKALAWFRKAADQGHANARENLGWMHQNGLGVER